MITRCDRFNIQWRLEDTNKRAVLREVRVREEPHVLGVLLRPALCQIGQQREDEISIIISISSILLVVYVSMYVMTK